MLHKLVKISYNPCTIDLKTETDNHIVKSALAPYF